MVKGRHAEQLSLDIDESVASAIPGRLRPMVPQPAPAPFDDADYFFEPWWPGASALLYVDRGSVRLETDHLVDPLVPFPELGRLALQFAHDATVAEGTLLALDADGRPDAELLRALLSTPDVAARVGERGTAAFVASDLLYVDGRALLARRFEDRRAQLGRELSESDNCVVSRGLRGEGLTLAEAVASMGLADISAKLLAGRYRPGQQDASWLRMPVAESPAAPNRPLLALLQRLPL